VRRHPLFFPFRSPLLFLICSSLFSFSCEEKQSHIVDVIGYPPQIIYATLSPSKVNSDTINIGPERRPDDLLSFKVAVSAKISHPRGQHHIQETSFTFFRTKREPEITHGYLQDNGIPPDSATGDSVFSGFLGFSVVRTEIGSLYAEVVATDAEGYRSNSIRIPFTLLRLNHPPVLSNLVAPDTVHPSTESFFVVTVVATDPDGLADILSVTRTTPSNLVLSLNDNGQNVDEIAGDGIFTETVSLSPAPPSGPYQFIFKAVDRSNTPSQIITKTIVVAP